MPKNATFEIVQRLAFLMDLVAANVSSLHLNSRKTSEPTHVGCYGSGVRVAAFGLWNALLALIISAFSFQFSAVAQTYSIDWHTMDGGGVSTNDPWEIRGTSGQPDSGNLSGSGWQVQGGFWNRVSGNLTPIAPSITVSRNRGVAFKFAITALMTNAYDPDVETVLFAGTSATSTNGATISTNSTLVLYTPPGTNPDVPDRFTFRVRDGFQGLGLGSVFVTLNPDPTNQSANVVGIAPNGDGNVTITFAGIPNYSYLVQAATNLGPPFPVYWETLSNNSGGVIFIAGPNGLWSHTDRNATNFPSRFYRSALP